MKHVVQNIINEVILCLENIINEVILCLENEDLHSRALSGLLGVSYITIGWKLMDLRKENAGDFSMKGKNKVFFLKRTVEGRNAAMMAEIYRQPRSVPRWKRSSEPPGFQCSSPR